MTRQKKWTKSTLGILALTLVAGMSAALAETNTYNSTDVPKAIIDIETITSTLTVPCDAQITDVNVQLDITHNYDNDLDIFLIAPDGTRIELSTDNGGLGNNYTGTIFDDEAATSVTAGAPPFAGAFQPEGSLAALDGKSREGTWTLEVTDDLLSDTGTLNSWSLTIETTDTTIPSSDIPKAIPDLNTTTSTITSCNTFKITDVNVQLDITHTWDEDLDIFLIAPDGTRIELSTDNGGRSANYTGTVFDDEAATSVTAGAPPFAGAFQPEETLSVLDGMTANGTWTLEVTDDELSAAGTLNSWSLIFGLIDPDYNLSTYVSGLSAQPAGLTVDPATGTFYFADFGNCEGQLQKIAPDRTVSIVTSDFTPNSGVSCSDMFYRFRSTDIQSLNGSVYVPLSDGMDGELVRINTDSGTTVVEKSFAGFGIEGGLALKNCLLLVTSGRGPATEVQSYNTDTRTAGLALDVSPLTSVMSVKYDRKNNATYFWSDNAFYRADLDAGTYSAIPSYNTARDDFVISPDGNYLITTNQSNIDLVSVADGSSTTLYTNLTNPSRHDMVLADSSSGGGCSLYIVDNTGILEISGFEECRSFHEECRSFPWPMFLPAITNHSSP